MSQAHLRPTPQLCHWRSQSPSGNIPHELFILARRCLAGENKNSERTAGFQTKSLAKRELVFEAASVSVPTGIPGTS